MQHKDIIRFWFEEIEPAQWWAKDEAFDQLIRERFSDIHTKAFRGDLADWRKEPKGRLAEVIVLDQFSRNMFRGKPESFAYDEQALCLAQEAIEVGADQALTPVQRSFLYLPFMHSESLDVHETAVALYEKNGIQNNLDFEFKHKRIIERFGRYPHRNAVLGRTSTPEEIDFLRQPGSGF